MWLNVRNGSGDIDSRPFDDGALVVGRDDDCDLVLEDERASRRHAKLSWLSAGRLQVEDIGSTNGTFVNGVRIAGPTAVRPGDEVRVGRHLLRVSVDVRPAGPATVLGRSEPPSVLAPVIDVTTASGGPGSAGAPVSGPPVSGPPVLGPGVFGGRQVRRRGRPAITSAPGTSHGRRFRHPRRLAIAGSTAIVVAVVLTLVVTQRGGSSNLTPRQLARIWGPSTLYVLTDRAGQSQDSGSAWVYNASKGLLVTNAHVVDGGTSYTVGQGPNRQTAELIAASPCDDLAVAKVLDTTGLRSFDLGRQADVQQGEDATALGYPGNSAATPNLSVTNGIVSVTQTRFDVESLDAPHYPDVVETDAPINPGNSGGPLLDNRGRLIGINTAGITVQGGDIIQGEGYAIGVDRAKAVLAQLAAGHSTGFTGMNFVFPTQPSDFTSLGLPVVDGGIIVPSADPNSPALDAGFGIDGPMIITAINGHPLDGTLASYCQVVGADQAGQTASFSVVLANGTGGHVVVGFE